MSRNVVKWRSKVNESRTALGTVMFLVHCTPNIYTMFQVILTEDDKVMLRTSSEMVLKKKGHDSKFELGKVIVLALCTP